MKGGSLYFKFGHFQFKNGIAPNSCIAFLEVLLEHFVLLDIPDTRVHGVAYVTPGAGQEFYALSGNFPLTKNPLLQE